MYVYFIYSGQIYARWFHFIANGKKYQHVAETIQISARLFSFCVRTPWIPNELFQKYHLLIDKDELVIKTYCVSMCLGNKNVCRLKPLPCDFLDVSEVDFSPSYVVISLHTYSSPHDSKVSILNVLLRHIGF